jgi:hypothetical protein
MTDQNPFHAVAHSWFNEECRNATNDQKAIVEAIIDNFIDSGQISLEEASSSISAIIGNHVEFIKKIYVILTVPETPLSGRTDMLSARGSVRKGHPWTSIEDTRLLAGIHKYRTNNWMAVAVFVGNNRTSAQCSQRWNRGLNPKLKKAIWVPDEERQLLDLVAKYGKKAWAKIACEMGNRSDVQCRYQFLRMERSERIGDLAGRDDSIQKEKAEDTPASIELKSAETPSMHNLFGSISNFCLFGFEPGRPFSHFETLF